jgi:hypothetical protein
MILFTELSVRLLDIILRRVPLNSENIIVLETRLRQRDVAQHYPENGSPHLLFFSVVAV